MNKSPIADCWPIIARKHAAEAYLNHVHPDDLGILLDHIVTRAVALEPRVRRAGWSPAEDRFMIEHLGWLTDAEIGEQLGRSAIAVHLRWDRDLGLPGPSKAPDVITAHKAAAALGIDSHKIAHWVDAGLIPGRLMAGGRKIRLIQRVTFLRWVCAPRNWIYFDRRRVADAHLRRLLQLEAKRWGDAWLSTRQAADLKGVDTKVILQQIKMRRLPSAVRVPVSYGGRHQDRHWSFWFVLRSEVRALRIPMGIGAPGYARSRSALTPAGEAWIRRALQRGMNCVDIGRTMKRDPKTVRYWIHHYFPAHHFPKGRTAWSKYRNSTRRSS